MPPSGSTRFTTRATAPFSAPRSRAPWVEASVDALVYDGWKLIAEYSPGNAQRARYIHGPGPDELLLRSDPAGLAYYHHDGLGSTRTLTDETGAVLENYTYDVFGRTSFFSAAGVPLGASAAGNRFLFTGREWLASVELYDYRNRVYSPQTGRFLQTDPIRFDAGDMSLFRYVGSNPINNVDPEGLILVNIALGALGGLAEFGFQLALNGGKIECVDWADVGISAVATGSGAGILSAASKLSKLPKAARTLEKASLKKVP